MPRDYIPSSDAGKLAFGNNMVDLITPDPVVWGLTAAILATLSGRVSDYGTKLAAATEPATKSRSNTYAKNQARTLMVQYIRDVIVPAIQGTATVTDQMKYDMGLTVRGANPPTPINAPTEAPMFEVLWVKNRLIGVKLHAVDSTRRGRPDGVQGCSVCMYAGPLPLPTDVTAWTTIGESTRTGFEVELPASIAPGTQVYLVAFWKSPRLMSGPPSAPVSVYIGGGVQQAA
ncbi:MAG TPA: hypothetical protein VGR35_13950 [Tepidisphaeraceae bacterium]|nr:hypothetical protein [Tepidisphaeraceae bacterium]